MSEWRCEGRCDVTTYQMRVHIDVRGMRNYRIQNEEVHLGVPELHDSIITLISMY